MKAAERFANVTRLRKILIDRLMIAGLGVKFGVSELTLAVLCSQPVVDADIAA